MSASTAKPPSPVGGGSNASARRRRLLALGVAAALNTPGAAYAAAGWTDYAGVAELVATDKHYYRFRLTLKGNPSGCRDHSWFFQNYGTPGADKIFDTLLEAIKADLRVRVYVTGICNLDGHAEISSAGIVP